MDEFSASASTKENPLGRVRRQAVDPQFEMRDRLRRIETRMTAWMEWSGYRAQTEKPKLISCFSGETGIEIPSLDVRLIDILNLIETSTYASKADGLPIFHQNKLVGLFVKKD